LFFFAGFPALTIGDPRFSGKLPIGHGLSASLRKPGINPAAPLSTPTPASAASGFSGAGSGD
jgi:hypothetical protein